MYSNALTVSRPAANGRRRLPRLAGVVAVMMVLSLAAYGCGANLQYGKVLFGTDIPTANSQCAPSTPVTTVSATTSVYAVYVFKAKPGTETISLEITKGGSSFYPKTEVPSTYTQGLDCFGDTTDLSKLQGWGPGTYHFAMTANGSDVAAGDLTVN